MCEKVSEIKIYELNVKELKFLKSHISKRLEGLDEETKSTSEMEEDEMEEDTRVENGSPSLKRSAGDANDADEYIRPKKISAFQTQESRKLVNVENYFGSLKEIGVDYNINSRERNAQGHKKNFSKNQVKSSAKKFKPTCENKTPIVIKSTKIWPELNKKLDSSKIMVNRATVCKEGIRVHPEPIEDFRSMNKKLI